MRDGAPWRPVRFARVALALPLLAAALTGCLESDDPGADLGALDLYLFVYPGAEKAVPGADHGWLLRLGNPTDTPASFHAGVVGVRSAQLGPAGDDGWRTTPSPPAEAPREALWGGRVAVPAGGSVAFLLNVQTYDGEPGSQPVSLLFVRDDGQIREVPLPVEADVAGPAVRPGDHVRTVTVGVWVNGTSFYTNSASLLDDPGFPAGGNIDPAEARAEADPLAIYVYDRDRSEQPNGSRDTCHGTTIDGYNALLRSQVGSSTGVRFLQPGEGYTQPGGEDHFLYGDALVFLNTVVAHEGTTGPADAAPNPQGACFDAQRYSPLGS